MFVYNIPPLILRLANAHYALYSKDTEEKRILAEIKALRG
jgi:hypothetical protein